MLLLTAHLFFKLILTEKCNGCDRILQVREHIERSHRNQILIVNVTFNFYDTRWRLKDIKVQVDLKRNNENFSQILSYLTLLFQFGDKQVSYLQRLRPVISWVL